MQRKQGFTIGILALSLAACAGAYSGDPGQADVDGPEETEAVIGQAEQAWTAPCFSSSFHNFGVNVNTWSNIACVSGSPNDACALPWTIGNGEIGPVQGPFRPFAIGLNSGFSAGDKAAIIAASAPGANYLQGQFGSCTNRSGQQQSPYGVGSFVPGNWYMIFNKGPIAGAISGGSVPISSVMHLSCSASRPLSEVYAMNAFRCTQWTATIDYDKLFFWANQNCGSSCVARATNNLIKKAFLIGTGIGSQTSQPLSANYVNVDKNSDQTGFSFGERDWVCNAYASTDWVGDHLTCN